MTSQKSVEGFLCTEINGRWCEILCWIRDGSFQTFDKQKPNGSTSNMRNNGATSLRKEDMIHIDLMAPGTICNICSLSGSVLRKVQANVPSLLHSAAFFEIDSHNTKYVFGAYDSNERYRWMQAINAYSNGDSKGFNGTGNDVNGVSKSWSVLDVLGRSGDRSHVTSSQDIKAANTSATSGLEAYAQAPAEGDDTFDDDGDDNDGMGETYICKGTPCSLKIDTFTRLLKIITAFPFVLIISSADMALPAWAKTLVAIRFLNFLVYVLPFLFVSLILSQSKSESVQRLALYCYLALYLVPVACVVADRLKAAAKKDIIKDGTFSFKPASSIRWTIANLSMLSGFFLEWIQHVLYVIPLGIVTEDKATTMEELTEPFGMKGDFRVYFYFAFICILICALTLVLNSGLRGKLQYRVNSSSLLWFFYFSMGSPYYVSIVTIMFMGLSCDYSVDPPTLVQRPSVECWGGEHTTMAICALLGLALFLVPMTLLPAGTFKETMTDNSLDIMFVPVYLQAHCILKAIFCGVYVSFYTENVARCVTLTIINVGCLLLNNAMQPCSIPSMNALRDSFFICAVISGFQSLCYVAWEKTDGSNTNLYLTLMVVNQILVLIGSYLYQRTNSRSTEFEIAQSFLNLEWQVSRGGSVEPRVLEPLISLTLSDESSKSFKSDIEVAKRKISSLVWLLSYPNVRVQFQSAWALANLAGIDEDSRLQIHDAGGTKTLFQWYGDMIPWVQTEALAALTNLTISHEVSEDMVYKYDCIQFFTKLAADPFTLKVKFASIALANLAREEKYRKLIRNAGGIQTLIGCIMSPENAKRRYACAALANLALSRDKELEQMFLSKGLLNKVMKITSRNEMETQREVIGLLRVLCCRPSLRRSLLDRGVMRAIIKPSKTSPSHEIREWCEEITKIMELEVSVHGSSSQEDEESLNRIAPLESKIEWSTWGSKLNMIFNPIFSHIPTLSGQHIFTNLDEPIDVKLSNGVSNPALLTKHKDSLLYCVVEKPCHGRINSLTTSSDHFVYTPHVGYVGSDFFTYRLQLGSLSTPAVTISINVTDTVDLGDIELGGGNGKVDEEGKDLDGSSNGSEIVMNKKVRSVRKGKVELTKTATNRLRTDSGDAANKRIEDLFAIKGAAGAFGLKDRFNVPEANLGSKARASPNGKIRDISPMRNRTGGGNSGYQELPSLQGNKRVGATSSSKYNR